MASMVHGTTSDSSSPAPANTDYRALPGIEWRLTVDREAAARFGADVLSVGNAVQMITNGLKLAT